MNRALAAAMETLLIKRQFQGVVQKEFTDIVTLGQENDDMTMRQVRSSFVPVGMLVA